MKVYPHNVMTIKQENRALIFHYFRKGPTSRTEISKLSSLSKSAVTMIINELIEEGQIKEIGTTPSIRGRETVLLDIVPDYKYAAGIALHRNYVYVCLTDLKSNIVAYSNHSISKWNDPYSVLDFAIKEIKRFLKKLKISKEKCIGIGVSAPGPLDYVSGTILNPPDFELFHNVKIAEYIKEKIGLPVMLDNNAVLLAMQEYISREDFGYKNSMFVVVSDGIGSAITTSGQIYRGSGGFAGELGHTSIHSGGIKCSCGNVGCLEKYITVRALKNKFGFESYESLVDDAYMGDDKAKQIMEYIADEFSYAIINAVNMFDLDGVIIYGEFSYKYEMLQSLLQERVDKHSVVKRNHDVKIDFSGMPSNISKASACAAVINRYFEQKI